MAPTAVAAAFSAPATTISCFGLRPASGPLDRAKGEADEPPDRCEAMAVGVIGTAVPRAREKLKTDRIRISGCPTLPFLPGGVQA